MTRITFLCFLYLKQLQENISSKSSRVAHLNDVVQRLSHLISNASIKSSRDDVIRQFSEIETTLKERYDLYKNLSEKIVCIDERVPLFCDQLEQLQTKILAITRDMNSFDIDQLNARSKTMEVVILNISTFIENSDL